MLEDLLPDLADMVSNQLFSQDEVDLIVVQRREHEYKLARRTPMQRHFLKAIQFEMELEEKRSGRKAELQVSRPFSSDKSSTFHPVIRRITSLFQRMLRRFPGDLQTWKEYIRFCLKAKAQKQLSTAVVKALQLHPRSEDLWLIAEAVERSSKNDLDSSRTVLQKAVRVNPDCARLWLAYFRLELEFLQTILGKTEEGKLSPALAAGEIPRLVFVEAMKTLPREAAGDFGKACLEVGAPDALQKAIREYNGERVR